MYSNVAVMRQDIYGVHENREGVRIAHHTFSILDLIKFYDIFEKLRYFEKRQKSVIFISS